MGVVLIYYERVRGIIVLAFRQIRQSAERKVHLSRVGVRYAARHIVRRSIIRLVFRLDSYLASNQFDSPAREHE